MAVEKRTHRAVNVGLCAGLGVLAPLAAYAVTMPYETVHEIVASGAAPFAVGAVAGVGALAASLQVSERRGDASAEPLEESSDGFDRTAEAPLDATVASSSKRRRKKAKEEGPVIQRAPGALSDDEAWAEITSLLDDDPSVSCDASRSKDLYEIAFEELSRTEGAAASTSAATGSAGPDSTDVYMALADSAVHGVEAEGSEAGGSAGHDSAPPDSTAVYLSLVEDRSLGKNARTRHIPHRTAAASRPASCADTTDSYVSIAMGGAAATRSSAASTTVAAPAAPATVEEDSFTLDEDALCAAARDAAMTSLYGAEAAGSSSSVDMADAVAPDDEDATNPELSREEIWARAIAILEEEEDALEEVPRPRGAHFRSSPSIATMERAMEEQGLDEPTTLQYAVAARMATAAPVDDGTVEPDPGRVAAVAEGARETAMHRRVNELIEEEFDKVPSQSVRQMSREYLRVIQGGTGAMGRVEDDRMQAEA